MAIDIKLIRLWVNEGDDDDDGDDDGEPNDDVDVAIEGADLDTMGPTLGEEALLHLIGKGGDDASSDVDFNGRVDGVANSFWLCTVAALCEIT